MLHRYEKRTGETVSLGDLESGSLKSKLIEERLQQQGHG